MFAAKRPPVPDEVKMSDMMEEAPVVCALAAGDFKDRMVWIAELNMRSLQGARQDDLRLELDYVPAAIDDVRRLVAQEQQCCGFLAFELREQNDVITLSITAPEAAREAAEMVFGPFQEKSPQPSACGCTSGCGA